ncbi:MAG: YjbQ family protein, partial [Sphaerochaetaceae bacterium]|nr:YjbQ family protein [Sphaerochaetaceae bacterium]
PEKPCSRYQHNGYEDNADAHLKRTIMGRETVVAITEGIPGFGTRKPVLSFLCEKKEQPGIIS